VVQTCRTLVHRPAPGAVCLNITLLRIGTLQPCLFHSFATPACQAAIAHKRSCCRNRDVWQWCVCLAPSPWPHFLVSLCSLSYLLVAVAVLPIPFSPPPPPSRLGHFSHPQCILDLLAVRKKHGLDCRAKVLVRKAAGEVEEGGSGSKRA